MPLKPSHRAEACRLLSEAYEMAQEALLQGNSEDQADRWEEIAIALAEVQKAVLVAAVEATREGLGLSKRGKRNAPGD